MKLLKLGAILFMAVALSCGQPKDARQPIIDVHLHSESLQDLKSGGPNPVTGKEAPESVQEHIARTLAEMSRYNIVLGLVWGSLEEVEEFVRSAPDRFWAGLYHGIPGLDVGSLRSLYASGQLRVMGEVGAQYDGLSPSDQILDPHFALAESLDAPACVHMGMSFPGITQIAPKFRVSLGNPLLLEKMLNLHPKLRVWIAHMGFPYLEETIGILNVYPQVYTDTSAIDWLEPGFRSYLKNLIDYGLAERIMFGSDQMTWPEGIGLAVEAIEKADFLNAGQKRDILYNNAARFLRLSPEQIAKHHQDTKR